MGLPVTFATLAPLGSAITEINPGLTIWTLVTFAIVFVVLRWKAWGPILKVVKDREKVVADSLEKARLEREEASRLLAEQKDAILQARQEAAEMIRQNKAEVDRMREELILRSRREAEAQLATAARQIADEKGKALAEIRGYAVDLAIAGARKLVEVSLDEQHQQQLVSDYLSEIEKTPRA